MALSAYSYKLQLRHELQSRNAASHADVELYVALRCSSSSSPSPSPSSSSSSNSSSRFQMQTQNLLPRGDGWLGWYYMKPSTAGQDDCAAASLLPASPQPQTVKHDACGRLTLTGRSRVHQFISSSVHRCHGCRQLGRRHARRARISRRAPPFHWSSRPSQYGTGCTQRRIAQ